jgi:hypothetical protein
VASVVALALVGALAAPRVLGIDPYALAPAWFLAQRIEHGPYADALRAVGHINDRVASGGLSAWGRRLVDGALLDRMVDAKATWPPELQDALWEARSSGRLTPEQVEAHDRRAEDAFTLEARPVVRSGAAAPVRFRQTASRLGPAGGSFWGGGRDTLSLPFGIRWLSTTLHRVHADGTRTPVKLSLNAFGGGLGGSLDGGTSSAANSLLMAGALEPGRYEVTLESEIVVHDPVSVQAGPPESDAPGRRWRFTRSAGFDVTPADDMRVVFAEPLEVPAAGDTRIRVRGLVLDLAGSVTDRETGEPIGWQIVAIGVLPSPPLPPGAYDLIVRATWETPEIGGVAGTFELPEVLIGTATLEAGRGMGGRMGQRLRWGGPWHRLRRAFAPDRTAFTHDTVFADLSPLPGLRADLILRPSVLAAENSIEVTELAPVEFVWRDVPLVVAPWTGWPGSVRFDEAGFAPDEVRVLTQEERAELIRRAVAGTSAGSP